MIDLFSVARTLRRHEGFRKHVYRDSVGILTIGYGRNLEDNGISEFEARSLLYHDIERISDVLHHEVDWFHALSEIRKQVLVNMAYNLGVARLMTFTRMWSALQNGHYDRAADEMLDSKWARQVGVRATELAYMMKHDERQK